MKQKSTESKSPLVTLIFVLFVIMLFNQFRTNATISQIQDSISQLQGVTRELQSELTKTREQTTVAQSSSSTSSVQNLSDVAFSQAMPSGRTKEGALGGGAEAMEPSKSGPFCEDSFGGAHCDPKGELICDKGKKTRLRKGQSGTHKADVIRYVCMP